MTEYTCDVRFALKDAAKLGQAWAAGFFDARGVINEVKHGKYRSTLQLAINRSGDYEALSRFHNIVTYGTIYPYKAKSANHQDFWSYRVNGDEARFVYQLIEPHLTNWTKQRYASIEPSCA